jgi:hypothetical protein
VKNQFLTVIAMLVVVAGSLAGAVTPRTITGTTIEITVQLFNPANVSMSNMREAEREVSWLFQKAGIEVHWVECPVQVHGAPVDPACSQFGDPDVFVLSIITDRPHDRSNYALGFAMVFGESNHAAAFYKRISERLKNNPPYRDCNLLGLVLAHELAHLLFRSTEHGPGIMKANWVDSDFFAMRQRRLVFSDEQAQELRQKLAARMEMNSTYARLKPPR